MAVAHLPQPFELRPIVADALDKSGSADPHVIADAVIRGLSPTECREALSECLWLYVRSVASTPPPSVDNPDHRAPDTHHPRVGVVNDRAGRAGPIFAARFLAGRVPTADGYKFVRDFTAADAIHAADTRDAHAAANAAAAERYRRLAEAITSARVPTAGDLTPAQLKKVLG